MPVTKFGPLKATGAEIDAGANDDKFVTPKAIADSTIGEAWTEFTPGWVNLTEGNATNAGYYTIIGKTCHFRACIIFGNTTAVTGTISLTLPVTAATYGFSSNIGQATFYDAGTGNQEGQINSSGALFVNKADGAYSVRTIVNGSVPFTWTTNDVITVVGTYEIA
jgi:hypothetical protein